MDYYNIDSEIIDNLNILRPPVKRDRRLADGTLIGFLNSESDVQLIRNYTENEQTNYYNLRRELKSSLSLILQKTSQRKIIEQYSLYSCQSQNINHQIGESKQNKPTIKVTVIPKSERKPLLKHLKKHNRLPKTIHATCSNQENSLKSNNVFIVVAGPNKEKIYQLRTSGSAKITKDDFRGDVDDIYYNKVYKTYKMENRKQGSSNQRFAVSDATDDDLPINYNPRGCCCCVSGDTKNRDNKAGTSKIRIVGQLGVQDNNNYVIKCDASVNDQPVFNCPRQQTASSTDSAKFDLPSTVFNEIIKKFDKETMTVRAVASPLASCYERLENLEKLCKFINEEHLKKCFKPNDPLANQQVYKNDKNFNYEQQETHSTQVTINEPITTKKQDVQSIPANEKTVANNPNKSSADTLNDCKESEPIIIISVYPNPDALITVTEANTDMRTITLDKKALLMQKVKSYHGDKDDQNLNKNKEVRIQNVRRSVSPPIQPDYETKVHEKKEQFVAQARTVQYERSRSPYGNRCIKPSTNAKCKQASIINNGTKQQNEKNPYNKFSTERNQTKITRTTQKVREQGINTDKIQTRNIGVDRLNKKTLKQKMKKNSTAAKNNLMNDQSTNENKMLSPKKDVSKVLVNINSESEFYDVIFEQGKYRTDLTVKKSLKEPVTRRDFSCDKSDSLENSLVREVTTTPRNRRSGSQVYQNSIDVPLAEHTSRINVRDSIEIGHRRVIKEHCHNIKDTQTKTGSADTATVNNETNFLAPIKHYPGDDCVIYDPMLRDKEIRELLGIQRIYKIQQAINTPSLPGQNTADSMLCQSILTGLMLNKICTCPTCAKKNQTTEVTEENTETKTQHQTKPKEKPIDREFFCDKSQESLLEATVKQKSIHLSRKQYSKVKRSIRKLSAKRQRGRMYWNSSITSFNKSKFKSEPVVHWDKEVQTDPVVLEIVAYKPNILKAVEKQGIPNENTIMIFSKSLGRDNNVRNVKINKDTRKISSSVDVRFTKSPVKKTVHSFTNIASLGSSTLERKKHKSVETLFRGQKKIRTPNIGASALCLVSEDGCKTASQSELMVADTKPRKPFLRRLMSCLVMRSGRVSNPKAYDDADVKCQPLTNNSSVDSYHISTSLAAFEMTSSLYDTSASFYSTHTIGPHNHKVKRGFLSSVRGFLTTRKI